MYWARETQGPSVHCSGSGRACGSSWSARWLQHYPKAASFYRELLDLKPAGTLVTGLVEDGMIEEAIPLSVALFAETLWDPFEDDAGILRRAMSPHYQRYSPE